MSVLRRSPSVGPWPGIMIANAYPLVVVPHIQTFHTWMLRVQSDTLSVKSRTSAFIPLLNVVPQRVFDASKGRAIDYRLKG